MMTHNSCYDMTHDSPLMTPMSLHFRLMLFDGRCAVSASWGAVASKKQWRKKITHDFHKIHSVFFERRVFSMFFKIFNMLNFDPKQAGWLSFKKLVWIILFISLTMFS